MFNRTNYTYYSRFMLLLLAGLVLLSCEKSKTLAEDPYAGGKTVLDINFETKSGDLEETNVNEELQLKVRGLVKYKGQFKFFINDVETEILSYSDSTLNFIIPESASTGSVWVIADGQTFFGPIVKVGGKVSLDESFKVVNGAMRLKSDGSATIYDIIELPSGRFWLGGAFNDFEQKGSEAKPIGGIVQLADNGGYATNDIDFGIGLIGGGQTIFSINRIGTGNENGKFIIAGSFTGYNSKRTNRQTINNITRLLGNGKLDTIVTSDIVNPKPAETWKNKDTIPAFNGGVDGVVRKTFVFGDKIYVIGNFQNYKRIYYPNSTHDEKVFDVTRMLQLVRMNMDGSMDSTFHYDEVAKQSARAANGGITDAMMQEDGKLILVGNFTSFNNTPVGRIVRLNLDGSVDPSFSSAAGANGDINSIRFNESTKKIMISGSFTSFGGASISGIAMLNQDGSLDANFQPESLTGGGATFAAQLKNEKILVAGTFSKYGEYVRQGFMILNPDGSLAQGYNNTGGFVGRVYDMVEKTSEEGLKVTLVGDITRFNATLPKNILRIIISN